jgi:malonyl-CoA/methylmalonyl-CoA synthetase
MTELGMALTNPLKGQRKKGFVGFPLPYVTVRLLDDNGTEIVTPNMPGELQVQGKTMFKRYLNNPEATRDSFDGNWFKTGDIAEFDEEGYYKLLGRNSSDIIKVSVC